MPTNRTRSRRRRPSPASRSRRTHTTTRASTTESNRDALDVITKKIQVLDNEINRAILLFRKASDRTDVVEEEEE